MSSRRSMAELLNGEWYSRISRTQLRALSIAAPHSNRFRVRLQPLGLRQRHHGVANAVQAITRELLDRDGLYKILHAEPAAEAGHRTCGQDVIWAGGVVACGLRRVITNKDGTRVGDVRQ